MRGAPFVIVKVIARVLPLPPNVALVENVAGLLGGIVLSRDAGK